METIGKVRRRYFVKKQTLGEIAREMHLSRNTVKKLLRAEPKYCRNRQPRSQLGAYVEALGPRLATDRQRPNSQRRTARRLCEELQLAGYQGAYDKHPAVGAAVARAAPKPPSVFIPRVFAPGEAYQFDWSHEQVELAGLPQTVKVAHFRLCHSRLPFVVAYPHETQERGLEAHARAFAFGGGVPERGIYDNFKAAVDPVYRGKSRQFNRRCLALMSHYWVEPVACTPAAGGEKGQVENQVGKVREGWFPPRPSFPTLAALNEWLQARGLKLARTRAHPEPDRRLLGAVFEEARAALRPVTAPFDGYAEQDSRVTSPRLVHYDRNRHGVECAYVGPRGQRASLCRPGGVWAEGRAIAEHERRFGRNQVVYDPWHSLAALQVKPGAMARRLRGALPQPLQSVRTHRLNRPGGDREFVELLRLARPAGLETLTVASALALAQNEVNTPPTIEQNFGLTSQRSLSALA
jgi:transposase